jgi:hypothetical protein
MRRGTKTHAVLETGRGVEGLEPDEREVYWQLTSKMRRTLWDLYEIDPSKLPAGWRAINEVRLALYDKRWGPRPFSGKPDVVLINEKEKRAFIGDYKTGYAWVEPASENLQLRALAVLLAGQFALDEITVAIWQPFVAGDTPATYSATDLCAARQWLIDSVEAAMTPSAPATPHATACKYCKARSTCEEARGVMSKVEATTPAELSVEEMPQMLAACDVAESIIFKVRELAFNALEGDPRSIDGWKIKDGRKTRKIADCSKLREAVEGSGLLGESDFKRLTFGLPDIEKLIAEAAGIKKVEAKTRLAEVAGELIETKQAKSSLARE